MNKMKKYINLFLCAAIALTACQNLTPEKIVPTEEYAGSRASVELSSADPISADGGTITAKVHRSPAFETSLPKTADWITISQADSTLSITAKANPSAVSRYAHVSIIDKELKISATSFDVVQAGTAKEIIHKSFLASTESLLAKAEDTSASFSILASGVAWTVSSSNSAFVPDPASGEGDATITVNFPANTEPSEVTAVITISTTDEAVTTKELTVTITQAAAKAGTAIKPAVGTVLAEWEFDTPQIEALRAGGFEQTSSSPEVDAPGNMGGAYVPSNVSGNGKLEYYNGVDKSTVKTKTCVKRAIGNRGEPVIYGTWVGDWFTWTAELDAPLAAGTKFTLNFVLRPNTASVMKYWKCEYLDGDQWVELDTIELEFHSDAANTEEDPKQINKFIVETATLTKDTPYAQFRFTCTQNAQCGDGTPLDVLSANHVLRFAGKWSDPDATAYLRVPDNPKIIVVE